MAVRRLSHLAVAIAVFLVVTFGLEPAVNLVARVCSPSGYDEYAMSGTWGAGVLATSGYLCVAWLVGRMRRHRATG